MKPTYEELEAKCQLQKDKLDSINQLMGVIESASDLAKSGIKKLEQQLAAVVAENAGLKKFCKNAAFDADYEAELCMEQGGFTDALDEIKTPATDAAIANIQAQGVEMFADMTDKVADEEEFYDNGESFDSLKYTAKQARLFAAQLRQGAAL